MFPVSGMGIYPSYPTIKQIIIKFIEDEDELLQNEIDEAMQEIDAGQDMDFIPTPPATPDLTKDIL